MPMLNPAHPIAQLLKDDRRYKLDAYIFMFEALQFAQDVLNMGAESASEEADEPKEEKKSKKSRRHAREEDDPSQRGDDFAIEEMEERHRHVSGQQLCEAIRRYAMEQYGYMAKTVLNSWGVHTTGDFGEIVFNLIRIGQMRKTPSDTRVDFDNLYDFETAFRQEYKITPR